ncbi:NADPH-dependent glutamate synthase beta subunit [Oceaniovalibus guishaninsula JLT2003]|uniref:NADPH-dependent glutamate synthase beta subunit n=1 Tax=Oceaniovalibus guishaninsula JLT2003 TaxID=1231392 RepID=K2GSG2_9RHOB|nr:NAD(P)-dependent oxidoreductase [Oceaniovalibus guishaninsula]EKE45516.1 NADPH-dependent glutamate synthase beta subunit [Oceaniovalibus guishaninsula JLT2003]
MNDASRMPGLRAGRLSPEIYALNFSDAYPPLDRHEALVAADRCYFCHDAPCVTACPTEIDIPLFIRQIATGTPEAAAKTIFDQNILGGMCARVCPTETLCEEACVRELAEGKPVRIGALQRHATDTLMARGVHPFVRAAPTGRQVAVVGAGPAGLACAHRLALHGHAVTLFEARPKAGGLNEYGIASYKTVDGFAQAEVEWLMQIGGIGIETGRMLGRDLSLETLREEFDAVFLGLGLPAAYALEGAAQAGVRAAVDFIADLRQADDLSALPVGRDVVVIGGGMTAIDAAVQARLLGAEHVTIVYRRGPDRMPASVKEQRHATARGVRILHNAQPVAVLGEGRATGVEFAYTAETDGRLAPTGETFVLKADQVLLAIGQWLEDAPDGLERDGARLRTDARGRTTMAGVWAGGDCVAGNAGLTVAAVAQGRDAAEDIHTALGAGKDTR